MRWKQHQKPTPKPGDTRFVTKFLLLPVCICGECRWLEKVTIQQRYRDVAWDDLGGAPTMWGWVNFAWAMLD